MCQSVFHNLYYVVQKLPYMVVGWEQQWSGPHYVLLSYLYTEISVIVNKIKVHMLMAGECSKGRG